jgi:quinohemoprotein ethanol dehydrogenase
MNRTSSAVRGIAGALLCVALFAVGRADEVTEARIAAADTGAGDWLTVGRDYGDTRFSPLRDINDGNVARLQLAWYYDLDTDRGQQATPVTVDGVLYTTSAWSKVQAFRATSGELLW